MLKPDYLSAPKNITFKRAFEEILEFFNHDKDKTISWYLTPNPLLGNISPYEMIKIGRGQKLMKFIRASLKENYR